MRHSSDRPAQALQQYASRGLVAFFLLGALLLGCSRAESVTSSGSGRASSMAESPASSQPIVQATPNAPQKLPLSAQVKIADQVIQLEVARTAEQQEIGLMYRTDLPKDRGMVFPFEPPRRVGFWMKNTLIPLDIIFLLQGKVQAISSNVPPCNADPCPVYGPNALVDQVIELRAGRATELKLKQGDRVTLQQR